MTAIRGGEVQVPVTYAIIQSGGQQFKAAPGEILYIQKLPVEVGRQVEFDQVLALSLEGDFQVGTPVLEGAKAVGKVLAHERGPKIIIFKYKPKKNYRRKKGHRQGYTKVLIEAILPGA